MLRPLRHALADGDRILGVIRASAMNASGRTSGYTVPSPAAQAEVVAEAIGRAGVDPAAIGYVEAHGTGTALGDPIEVEGLARAFGPAVSAGACALGSVKALVGHLEAAAAVAGLARIVLQFQHDEIAPAPLRGPVNPAIDLGATPFILPDRAMPWPRPKAPGDGTRQLAGLSSFGAGGANLHLLLEEPPPRAAGAPPPPLPEVVPLSARTAEQLAELAQRVADALAAPDTDVTLAEVAHTQQTGREPLACRAAFVVEGLPELRDRLRAFVAGGPGAATHAGLDGGKPLEPETEQDRAEAVRAKGDLSALAARWVGGADVPWAVLRSGPPPRRVALPGYPFARERCWPAGLQPPGPRRAADARASALHPLLERALPALHEARFALPLDPAHWLCAEHRVDGTVVLPGAVVLEAARAAAALVSGRPASALADVAWLATLPVQAPAEAVLTLVEQGGVLRFELATASAEGGRRLHASGLVLRNGEHSPAAACDTTAVAARLPERLAGPAMYDRLERLGIAYGPRFRRIAEIACGPDEALATVELDAETRADLAAMPLHPAVLDAAMQAGAGVLGASGHSEAFVPFLVETVALHASLERARFVHVRRAAQRPANSAEARLDISVLDAAGTVLAELAGLTLKQRRAAGPTAGETVGNGDAPLDALDRVAALRVLAHLQACGLFAEPGVPVQTATIRRLLRLADRHERFVEAVLDLLVRRRWIARDVGGTLSALPTTGTLAKGGDWRSEQSRLLSAEPALAPHLELLDRCMTDLGGILDGRVPATDAFFPGGSPDLLARVYAGDAHADRFHAAVADAVVGAVRAAAAADTAGPPRVVEIGSGTGGTSAHVLRALAAAGLAAEYTYTDVSPQFLQHARTHFAPANPGLRTALLDIERDPEEQGFAPGTFDVALAANVLHATRDIGATLSHAVRLLAPGGTLVLNEMTAVRDYATVTFGLLEGWWRAADPERRLPHAPLLSVPLWREALAAAGLEVVATTPPAEDDPGSTPQAVLVARAEPARSGPDPAGVERRTAIEAAVIEVVAEVFEMPEQKVRTSGVLSFSELGADSLLSAELAARIGARLAIPLKTTAIFNFPGIRELAAHIEAEFPNAALPATGPPMPHPPTAPDEDVLGRVLRALEAGEIDVDEALRRAPLSP